jgi:hypothetical protein
MRKLAALMQLTGSMTAPDGTRASAQASRASPRSSHSQFLQKSAQSKEGYAVAKTVPRTQHP